MKTIYLISVIETIISVVSAIESGYSKVCPTECVTVIDTCLESNNIGNGISFTSYPPTGELGKCFCKDPTAYFNCLNCYGTKKAKKVYTAEQVQAQCTKVTGVAAVIDPAAAAAAGTAGTAAGTAGAAGAAGAANTVAKGNKAKATGAAATTAGTSQATDGAEDKNNGNSSGNGTLGFIIVGAVAAAGVVGYAFYSRKQKERPESMPFFSNSAASPNQYATLNTPKDMGMTESTSNLTSSYNQQYFSDVGTVDTTNQYYNQSSSYGAGFDQSQSQYNASYQNYNNQYPATTYENEIAGAAVVQPPVSQANYESRRESMMPNVQPTNTNFNGVYVVAYKYEPQLDDELELQVGDQVQIIEEYEDGWMKATNLSTNREGMAPRVCIKEA